jgi:hypothetical protein
MEIIAEISFVYVAGIKSAPIYLTAVISKMFIDIATDTKS